jgi:hypothetical protein
LFSLLGVAAMEGIVRRKVKIIEQARSFKPGETVFDGGTSFIVKEVRVIGEDGWVSFLDTDGVWHGVYHPNEYLGVEERLANMLSG